MALAIAGLFVLLVALLVAWRYRSVTRLNRALQAAEARWQSLTEYSPDQILEVDRDGRATFASRGSGDFTREQLVGQCLYDLLAPEEARRLRECFEAVWATAATRICEISYVSRDGASSQILEARAGPVLQQGQVVALTVSLSDVTERTRVQEAHRQAEERWRSLTENSPDLIIEMDRHGKALFVNRDSPDFRREDIIGSSLYDMVDPKQAPSLKACAERVWSTGEPDRIEAVYIGKDGVEQIMDLRVGPVRRGGEVVGISINCSDVTEKRRADAAIQESEARWRSLAENSPDWIVEVDREGTALFINRDSGDYRREELVGRCLYELLGGEDIATVRACAERVWSTGRPDRCQIVYRGRDGKVEDIDVRFAPIKHEGKVVSLTLSCSEVSELKRAQERIAESEAKWRAITENSPYWIVQVDHDGTIHFANRDTPDFSRAEILGTCLYDLVVGENASILKECLEGVWRTGQAGECEVEYVDPGGIAQAMEVRAGPIMHGGHVAALTVSCSDVTERKRAEVELRESREKLAGIIGSITDHVSMMDRELTVVWANHVAREIFGDSLIGEKCYRLYHRRDQPCASCVVHQVFEDGQIHEHETRVLGADGNEYHFWCTASVATWDTDGRPKTVIEISRDVTARKKAEQELRENQERLRAALDAASEGTWEWNLATDQIILDDAGLEILGFAGQDVTTDAGFWWSKVHPDDAIRLRLTLQEKLAEGAGSYRDEVRAKTGSGQWRWVGTCARVVERDRSGNPIRIVGTHRDITAEKRAEEELRRERNFSNTLVQASPAFFVAIDPQGKTILMNDAMLAAIGYSSEEVKGKDFLESFVPPSDHEPIGRVFRELVKSRKSTVNESRILTKAGRELLVEWHGRSVFAEDGAIGYFFGVGIDITERRAIEEEKVALEEQLHQAQKMEAVGQLAAGVAHDFNNLTTAILGNVEAARRALGENGTVADALKMIEQATQQAMEVTRSLLTFSHKLPILKRPEDLVGIVRQAARLLRRMLPASIELSVHTGVEDPLIVRADGTQLQQVLLNLAINARDAMPGGGCLSILLSRLSAGDLDEIKGDPGIESPTVASASEYALLTVADTGIGMPPVVRSRAFEPFFTTKPRGQGTGLGLSIAHGIIKEHGGIIDLESEVGTGTTLRILLPLLPAAFLAAVDDPLAPENLPLGDGELILLAEDSRFVRETVAMMLDSLRYRVVQAVDGDTLIESYRQYGREIRVMIIDQDLPKRSGAACVRDLRGEGVETPVIFVSGSPEFELPSGPIANTSLLRKPFQKSELARLIRRMFLMVASEEKTK
ncbi:MAG: PAS domain S-box protein [Phycisphaerae bacterium]|nr:PAS domain S-box protein [Phycisphaerae bacterium]